MRDYIKKYASERVKRKKLKKETIRCSSTSMIRGCNLRIIIFSDLWYSDATMKPVDRSELTIDTSLDVVGLILILSQVWYLLFSMFSRLIAQHAFLCTSASKTCEIASSSQWSPSTYLATLLSSPAAIGSLSLDMLHSSLSETLFSVVIVLLGVLYLSGLPTRWAAYKGSIPLQYRPGPDTPPPRCGFAI